MRSPGDPTDALAVDMRDDSATRRAIHDAWRNCSESRAVVGGGVGGGCKESAQATPGPHHQRLRRVDGDRLRRHVFHLDVLIGAIRGCCDGAVGVPHLDVVAERRAEWGWLAEREGHLLGLCRRAEALHGATERPAGFLSGPLRVT